jgi:hypothetical protein
VYGAVFLLLGTLAVAEALAGGVWHRVQWRRLIQPAALTLMGTVVLIANAMQVTPNPLHLVLGGLLMAGGALEWEACVRGYRSNVADATIIAILVGGAMVLGPLHHPPSLERVDVIHWLSALALIALAAVRLLQSYRPASARLVTASGLIFMLLGLALLQMPDNHHHGSDPAEAAGFSREVTELWE